MHYIGMAAMQLPAVVELHGGTVSAESAGIGHGATFTVRLPCQAPTPVPGIPWTEQRQTV